MKLVFLPDCAEISVLTSICVTFRSADSKNPGKPGFGQTG